MVKTPITMHERWFLLIVLFSLTLLGTSRIILNIISIDLHESTFLLLHTLLESFSIFVSFSIFIQAMITYAPKQRNTHLFIGIIFFAVGTYDLIHTLLYKGMPFMNDEFAVARATWFWIIARLTECIGVGLAILFPLKFDIKKRWLSVTTTFIIVTIISSVIVIAPDRLPVLIGDTGMTSLKVTLEYIISAILFVTMVVLLKQYRKDRNIDLLTLIASIFLIMIAELFFTLYVHVFDMENLIGHIYKFLGYLFLYRAIFFPRIKEILTGLHLAETKWKEAEMKWKETEKTLVEVEKELSRQVFDAHEREMKRVSRELHDGIGQSLYSILVTLSIASNEKSEDKKEEVLCKLKEMTAGAMKEVKGIAHSLRPSALDDLGFFSALKSYVDDFQNTHKIQVEYVVTGERNRLNPDIETALYRICQEALTNAAKYSKASFIHVVIESTPEDITLTIEDNGIGFPVKTYIENQNRRGIGLYSMKERAEGLNGSMIISSTQNEGTTILIQIPKQ